MAARRYSGVLDCLVKVGQREGRRGLYAGIQPHLMRVVPNAAIMFLVVEVLVSHSM